MQTPPIIIATSTQQFDMTNNEILDLCRRLVSLLSDPEPGLATWCMARITVARALHDALRKVLK